MTSESHDHAHATDDHGHAAATFDDHFAPRDIDEFSDDDRIAGGNIGKMLAGFFFYTVLAMAFSAYWTYRAVSGH